MGYIVGYVLRYVALILFIWFFFSCAAYDKVVYTEPTVVILEATDSWVDYDDSTQTWYVVVSVGKDEYRFKLPTSMRFVERPLTQNP